MKKKHLEKPKVILLNFIFLVYTTLIYSQNPFITEIYTADPTARVFNDRLYVYPSHDVDVCSAGQGDNDYCMPDYHVFSTNDLVNWTDHDVIVDQNNVPWGEKNGYGMWAPDCIEKNGKYYFYFPSPPSDNKAFRRIGIAIADSPEGPFDIQQNPIPEIDAIDPGLFKDDDGKVYMYYAVSGELRGVQLKDNMVEAAFPAVNIPMPDGYKEGPFTFKKEGIYYFTFAHVADRNGIRAYEIGYATGDNPLGPFTYKGTIMPRIAQNEYNTNHSSVVNYKNKWYLFYHHWSLSGNDRLRSIRADEITFNSDGTINQKVATLRGIGIPKANDIIQIDRHNGINKAQIHSVEGNEPKGFQVDFIENNGWVRFNKVNFNNQLSEFKARVSSGSSGGTLEFRIGDPNGQLVASMPITNTGGWNNWSTVTTASNANVSGIKDLVCVFKGTNQYLFNLNWITFNGGTLSNDEAVINTNFDLKLSSNPLEVDKTYLMLSTTNTSALNFSLFDIKGKLISNKQLRNVAIGTNRIEVSSILPEVNSGVFFLKVNNGIAKKTIKLIVK